MRREFTLVETKALSPSVCGLTLRTADALPFDFVAGQWIDVHVTVDGIAQKRAYSIANAPGTPSRQQVELAVTRVDGGVMSNALSAMQVASALDVDGPHGFFTRDENAKTQPSVFVGTGTGLAPLRSMLQRETLSPNGAPLVLLFGCRSRDDLLWRAEIETWVARCPRLRVEFTLSRPDAAWSGRRGYVQTHIAELAAELPKPVVYICGLSRMVQDVRRVLKDELGFDRKQIQSERYD